MNQLQVVPDNRILREKLPACCRQPQQGEPSEEEEEGCDGWRRKEGAVPSSDMPMPMPMTWYNTCVCMWLVSKQQTDTTHEQTSDHMVIAYIYIILHIIG